MKTFKKIILTILTAKTVYKYSKKISLTKNWLLEKLKNAKNFIIRLVKPPTIPLNKDGSVLIHLGCGQENNPNYINVDAIPLPHVQIVSNVEKLIMFPGKYADLIYASHVLEHISHKNVIDVLIEWRRILKTGGILRLSVPDFDKIISIYNHENKEIESIVEPLMGGQNYEFNFHKSIFNETYLKKILADIGFSKITLWDPKSAKHYSFHDWANKLIKNKYPISLNIEAIK